MKEAKSMNKKLYIKGFDENLCCRNYQFEIGKEYDTGKTNNLKLCTATVFHFCKSLEQVDYYYGVSKDNRYCEIEVLGELIEDEEKCGSNKIRIVREIKGEELKKLKGLEKGNTGLWNTGSDNTGSNNTGSRNTGSNNTGSDNTGSYNTGRYNTGCRNTGSRNTGSDNTGWHNTGSYNTGSRNTGSRNTGSDNTGWYNPGDNNTGSNNTGSYNTGWYNTGWHNTGRRNTGSDNTGSYNTGRYNTGCRNTGDYNTGNFNQCNHSTGFFNTKERTITIFNMDSGMTYDQFMCSDYGRALQQAEFKLIEFIEYSDEEKADCDIKKCLGGYLKEYTYKEACNNWWNKLTDENKMIIQNIPNFNKDIFKEITGIEL